MEQITYGILFTGIGVINFLLSFCCFKKHSQEGRHLGDCFLCASMISFFYMLSIMASSYFLMSLTSSIYFCFIDVMLLLLLEFFCELAGVDTKRSLCSSRPAALFRIWAFIDCLVLMTNPIHNQAIRYRLTGSGTVAIWAFEPHILYRIHLFLCYLIIAYSLFILIKRMLSIPSLYRGSCMRIIFFILLIVALNAGYLLKKIQNNIDYSIILYTILGLGIYWAVFIRKKRSMLNLASRQIIENSAQPLLLFDYTNRLILANPAARNLFPSVQEEMDIRHFTRLLDMEARFSSLEQDCRFYWTSRDQEHTSYICSFQVLKDRHEETFARLFMFTSNALGIDPLTGFQSEHYFSLHRKEISAGTPTPVGVAVCDLNRLSLLNNTIGRDGGDTALSLQARTMKKHLPASSVFIRLHDANLCAVCYGLDYDELKKRLKNVSDELHTYSQFPFRLKMDSAICMPDGGMDAMDAAAKALSILKTRKLLDSESDHSSAIDSLRQMLMECDPETESHVQRTRALGDALACQMGLTDYERDQLSLLCLFHDIGKVGIPLHILNKPGPLTEHEQQIMRTHVQKGYRIAKATPELNIVAIPILHHHEFWNGEGYPDGLQHESIPLLSRIISVVDAYDAMVTDRVYRKGRSRKEACEELIRCSGTQFDPYIVDVFLKIAAPDCLPEAMDQEKTAASHTVPSQAVLVNPVRYSRYILDQNQRIIQADANFEQLTGYTLYDVENMKLTQDDLLFEDDTESYWNMVDDMLHSSDIVYLEHRIRRKDGTGRYVYCTGILNSVSDTGNPGTTVIVSDITDSISVQLQVGIARSRALMSLRRLEETIRLDPMTGLLNRAAFRSICEQELSAGKYRLLMIMMDVDNFKAYNDTFGHPQGDVLLISFASALSNAVGKGGIAGRMGGDEFCCMIRLEPDTPLNEIHSRAEEIWNSVSRDLAVLAENPTVSAGAVCSIQKYSSFQEIYTAADQELYHAKELGKHQLSISLPSL